MVASGIPLSVAGLADISGIEVRFVFGTNALRGVLVEAEPIGASHAFFVL